MAMYTFCIFAAHSLTCGRKSLVLFRKMWWCAALNSQSADAHNIQIYSVIHTDWWTSSVSTDNITCVHIKGHFDRTMLMTMTTTRYDNKRIVVPCIVILWICLQSCIYENVVIKQSVSVLSSECSKFTAECWFK